MWENRHRRAGADRLWWAAMSRFVPALVIAIALGGCGGGSGDDAPAPDAAPDGSPPGDHDDPADFDRTGCVPGSIDFVAPGILHGYAVFADFSGTVAVRVDSATAGVISGRLADRVVVT